MKNRIIIWGGNKKELTPENLDSHASISAYFLTKYLSKYYEITNLVDMDSPEEIMQYNDIFAVISTFQKGFTNRLMHKSKADLFYKIRKHIKGKLCSIYDYNYKSSEYYEDIIFTVKQPNLRNTKKIRSKSYNPGIVISWMGWCADPGFCYPIHIPKDEINVFIDHPPYSLKAPNCTFEYYKAFKEIKQKYPHIKLKVYHQNNKGIVKCDFEGKDTFDSSLYVRANKVPWKEMIETYKRMHIFCITHPESACLSAIEAAMCGAKLYIPKDGWGRTFLGGDLIKDGVAYSVFRCNPKSIVSTFLKDMKDGFEREKIHKTLSERN